MPDINNHPFKAIICGDCGKMVRVPQYCGDRTCQVCSRKRAFKIADRLNEFMRVCELQKKERFVHVILTIKNQVDLAAMLKHLVKSFRKLRNRKAWRSMVSGGAFVLEVSGAPGNWHGHLHIVAQANYFPQYILLEKWRAVAGSAGAYIKSIPRQSIIRYLTKYITKPTDCETELKEINDSLRDVRMFQPFGSWFKLLKKYMPKRFPCPNCGCQIWKSWDMICFKNDAQEILSCAWEP